MGNFVSHLITGLVTIAVIAAMAWFGLPIVYAHFRDTEQAVQTVKADKSALAADTADANARQKDCAAEVKAATAAGAAIAKAARPQPVAPGATRPMIGSDQIQAFMQ